MARSLFLILLASLAVLLGTLARPAKVQPESTADIAARQAVVDGTSRLTNAQRIARGLPLNRPRNLYRPGNIQQRNVVSRDTFPAGTMYPMTARYASSQNTVLGYVKLTQASGGRHTISPDLVTADLWEIPTTTPATQVQVQFRSWDFGNNTYIASATTFDNADTTNRVFRFSGIAFTFAPPASTFTIGNGADPRFQHQPSPEGILKWYFSKALNLLVSGASATRVNSQATGAAVTEADEVYLRYRTTS